MEVAGGSLFQISNGLLFVQMAATNISLSPGSQKSDTSREHLLGDDVISNLRRSSCAAEEDPWIEEVNDLRAHNRAKRRLWIAVVLCMFFFAVELAGGYLSGSLALFSDAFHLLTDVISFVISLSAIYITRWAPTRHHSFGFHRAEVIGALFSIVFIYVLTAFLVYEAIDRFKHPEEVNGKIMAIVAAIGVGVNIILATTLHHHPPSSDLSHCHSHSHHHEHGHDHSHGHSHSSSHTHENINIRAALIHVISDLLSSIGVLIAATIIAIDQHNHPERHSSPYAIADPICTLIFSVLVVGTSLPLLRDCFRVLMESTPRSINLDSLYEALDNEFVHVEKINIWTIAPGINAAMVALRLKHNVDIVKVVAETKHILKRHAKCREENCCVEVGF